MAEYRVRVESGAPTAGGDVDLDCWIERESTTPGVWDVVPNGHRTMRLDGASILAITAGAGTDAQKLSALAALFKATALEWGIDEADDAYNQLYALLPAGWPVNVGLEV